MCDHDNQARPAPATAAARDPRFDEARACREHEMRAAQASYAGAESAKSCEPTVLRELRQRRQTLRHQSVQLLQKLDTLDIVIGLFE